ncbi:hypothetical protein [Polaribacter porphyrae]|uniref:Uncharacterized protein n=1 Tax=Polaribacter porphyrae TaxID=1137780 RepID=A0A2S7WLB2_9FLAO|nr:hypothetical protein [Polaribacter porphyrae]PQJ78101.1 hypothetical protein BTO18_02340 [Polaribacter porphyrae]
MKNKIFLFLLVSAYTINSQEKSINDYFTKKEVKNLNQLNLSLNNYTFNDVDFNKDLKELAYYNKKRKQNKVWSYVLSGTGAFLLATGLVIDAGKDSQHGYKSLMYLNSAVYFGASIPFFVGNIKNKRRMRKKLLFVEEKLNTLQ